MGVLDLLIFSSAGVGIEIRYDISEEKRHHIDSATSCSNSDSQMKYYEMFEIYVYTY